MYNKDDFSKSIVVPIEKKANATECGYFRTISLIPHASKIVLKILTRTITARAGEFLGKNQLGFRKDCGTREAIGVTRMLCERSLKHDEFFICFGNFEKAFDRVKWTKLWHTVKKIGIDWRDRRLISNLCMQQEAIIRVGNGYCKPTYMYTGKGLR